MMFSVIINNKKNCYLIKENLGTIFMFSMLLDFKKLIHMPAGKILCAKDKTDVNSFAELLNARLTGVRSCLLNIMAFFRKDYQGSF